MKVKQEVLLCFSDLDNQPLEGDQKGWVTNLHRFLGTLLSQIAREAPEIKLVNGGNASSVDFSNAAVVLVVETPALNENTALVKQLNAFAKQSRAANTFIVDGLPRLFKVHKAPFEDDDSLSEFKELIPYHFYMIDPLSGEAQEFKRFFGNDAERSYWMKLVDMAYDINQIINTTEKAARSKDELDIPIEKTVYLASTGVDMVIQRDVIKRELIRHGYKVLPNHTLPKEAKLLEAMVKEDLHKCRLSIHMVGEDYGYRPAGSDLSVVDIQNRLASAHMKEMAEYNNKAKEKKLFSRLIWLSPDLANVTERQKIFIEDLKSEAATLDESEVLQITLQEFKGIIRDELVTGGRFKVHQHQSGYSVKDGGSKVIYLIHDKEDKKSSRPIQEFLEQKGFNVVAPSFEGDLTDIRYVHQENLRRCDASIIYYGKANEAWIKTKLQDLLKAPGFGREKALQAKAVYFDGSKSHDLSHYEKNNTMVLGNNGGFKPDDLKPFLTKIGK